MKQKIINNDVMRKGVYDSKYHTKIRMSKTKNRILSISIILILILMNAPLFSWAVDSNSLIITSDARNVKAGDEITVKVNYSTTGMVSLGALIEYDKMLELKSVSVASEERNALFEELYINLTKIDSDKDYNITEKNLTNGNKGITIIGNSGNTQGVARAGELITLVFKVSDDAQKGDKYAIKWRRDTFEQHKNFQEEENEVTLVDYEVTITDGEEEEPEAKDAKVIVKYIDIDTEKELKEATVKNGKVGDDYETQRATIEGNYESAGEEPTNAKGKMTEKDITVIYYYKEVKEEAKDAKVTVKYIDVDTKKEIKEATVISGKVGTDYNTEVASIDGYEKTNEQPSNAKGKMTEDEIVVTYYYKKVVETPVVEKTGKVITKYVDIDTNKEISSATVTSGKVGDSYTTKRISQSGYEKAGQEPANAQGKITEQDITVTYYYKKVQQGTSVSVQTGKTTSTTNTNQNKTVTKLPQTGTMNLIYLVIALSILTIALGIKYRKIKQIEQ